MDRDIIMQALKLIIMVATALITTYLIPWIKSHTDATKLYAVMRWAHEAVYAAEQIYGAGTGEEKKKYAEMFLRKVVDAAHIDVTDAELHTLIEAAVGQMNAETMYVLSPDTEIEIE